MPMPCMPNGTPDVHRLLAQQLDLMTQVISINKEIANQYRLQSSPTAWQPLVTTGTSCCAHPGPVVVVEHNFCSAPRAASEEVLLEPLLPPKRGYPLRDLDGDFEARDGDPDAKEIQGAQTRMQAMFPKVDVIKQTVCAALAKTKYDVEDMYSETGWFQWIARHSKFHMIGMVMVVLNTAWIGYETDANKAVILSQAPRIFQLADNVFCWFFTLELLTRFLACQVKVTAFRDGAFVFDLMLVFLMIWETWLEVILVESLGINPQNGVRGTGCLRLLRLVRLVRIARATKLVETFPELFILVRGIALGFRSVFAVFGLASLVIYVFAIVFVELLGKSEVVDYFRNVPTSMNFLLLTVLCGPERETMVELLHVGKQYYAVFVLFILIAVLTVMNMLIGILCNVVCEVAEESSEDAFEKEVAYQISRVAKKVDADESGKISKPEFDLIIQDTEMTSTLDEIGVNIVDLAEFVTFVFEQTDEITYKEFEQLAFCFRGGKTATVSDLMSVRRFITLELSNLEENCRTWRMEANGTVPQGPRTAAPSSFSMTPSRSPG